MSTIKILSVQPLRNSSLKEVLNKQQLSERKAFAQGVKFGKILQQYLRHIV